MATQKTDYEKLQDCARLVSSLIQIEKLKREGSVAVNDEALPIPDELMNKLKARFRDARVDLIVAVNSIHI